MVRITITPTDDSTPLSVEGDTSIAAIAYLTQFFLRLENGEKPHGGVPLPDDFIANLLGHVANAMASDDPDFEARNFDSIGECDYRIKIERSHVQPLTA